MAAAGVGKTPAGLWGESGCEVTTCAARSPAGCALAAAQAEHAWLPNQDWVLSDARAQVGLMLYNGAGVTRNPEEAAKSLPASLHSATPMPQSLQFLGAMYDAGDGVARNPVEAVSG